MESIGKRIKNLRNKKGWSANELGKRINVGESAIRNYESDYRTPKMDKLESLADVFNVSIDYLIGKTDTPNEYGFEDIFKSGIKKGTKILESLRMIPIYSCLSCGTGTWVNEYPEEQMSIPSSMVSPSAEYFANPAEGDSMFPLIHHGDYLIFEKADEIDSGKIGSFALNGEYYCKRLQIDPDGSVWLRSQNPEYEPILVSPEDDFRVLGLYRFKLSKEQ